MNDDWYEVELDNGRTGYIHTNKVFFHDASDALKDTITATVKESKAYVRIVPRANAKVLHVAWAGEKLEVVSMVGRWYEVRLPDGRQGFIFAERVSFP